MARVTRASRTAVTPRHRVGSRRPVTDAWAEEIVELEKRFRARHRIVAWGQAKLMSWPWPATEEQLRNLSGGLRAVAFAPRGTNAVVGDEVGSTCR
jgi:hypothetical protein